MGCYTPDAKNLKPEKGLPTKTAALISFAYLSSSLSLPLLLAGANDALEIVSWASCVLCVPVMYLSAKKTSHAVWLTILWFFLNAFLTSPVIPTLIFGSVIAISAASASICGTGSKGLIFISSATVISYVISAALTFDPIVSLFSLALLIPTLILVFVTKKKTAMTQSIASCGGGLIFVALVTLIYRIYALYGDIGQAGITLAADSFINAFVYYTEWALSEVNETVITPTVRQDIISAAESYINLAPGLAVAAALILAFFAHSMQKNLFYSYGIDKYLSVEMTALTVSLPAAVVFLLSYLLSFATSASGSVSIIAVIGNNLCIMLTPCLLLKGVAALRAIPLKLGFFGLLISGGIIIFLLFSPSLLSILALIGAFFVIIISIDRWAKDFYGKGENK